jgi:hypothetical protein
MPWLSEVSPLNFRDGLMPQGKCDILFAYYFGDNFTKPTTVSQILNVSFF